jgi:hypothetical protein
MDSKGFLVTLWIALLLIGGCSVRRLPPLSPPGCPSLPEYGSEGTVSLFAAKSASPYVVCARVHNGLSTPIWIMSHSLQPLNFLARLQWWWFCDQLGAKTMLAGAGASGVAPGMSGAFFLQPSCYGEGFAIPGTYEVVVNYTVPDLSSAGSSELRLRSQAFLLP